MSPMASMPPHRRSRQVFKLEKRGRLYHLLHARGAVHVSLKTAMSKLRHEPLVDACLSNNTRQIDRACHFWDEERGPSPNRSGSSKNCRSSPVGLTDALCWNSKDWQTLNADEHLLEQIANQRVATGTAAADRNPKSRLDDRRRQSVQGEGVPLRPSIRGWISSLLKTMALVTSIALMVHEQRHPMIDAGPTCGRTELFGGSSRVCKPGLISSRRY